MSNPFWEYSVRQYARQGVAETCIALQDGCALDVNMLLYAAWLASLGRQPDCEHIEALEREVHEWRERVVQPLRCLRRQWKELEQAAQLRSELKAIELRAERAQQDCMLAFYRADPPPVMVSADIGTNLSLVAECTGDGGTAWKPGVACLTRLLSG
jgi:uncharacterized protein (TIGR02444 family)